MIIRKSPFDTDDGNEVNQDMAQTNLAEIRAETNNIGQAQEANKKWYVAKRTKAHKFEVGQEVLVHKFIATNDSRSKKLLPKYSGPYVVTKVLENDRYFVEGLIRGSL